MSFVSGIGKTNVDLLYADMPKLPAVGEEIYTQHFSLQLGGGLPGTLINLARLNVPVRLATYLGDDLFSRFALQEYEKVGVNITNFNSETEIPVNITAAVILKNDRSFISYGKEQRQFTSQEKERFYQLAKGAKICYIENESLLDVYRQLKSEGTVLIYDTGWSDGLSLQLCETMLQLTDYFVPNSKEAMKLTDTDCPQDAAKVLSRYFENVIVKADAQGCYGMENGALFFIPSIQEYRCVDATGAGDAFLAGFIYGLYHNYSFRDCILLGNITGGKAVTAVGALSAYLSEDELLKKYQEHKEKASL